MLLVRLLLDLCFRSDLSFDDFSEILNFSRLTVRVLVLFSFSADVGVAIHLPSGDLVGPEPSRKLSEGMADISDWLVLGIRDAMVSFVGIRGLAGRRLRELRPKSIPISMG
jgi:hypothetical protein